MKPKKRNDWTPGYCYIFYDRQAKLHKIGLSRNPSRRRWYLCKEYKTTLDTKAIAYTPNMRLMEKILHALFQKRRYYRGEMDGGTEWFAVRGMSAIAAFYLIAILVWLMYLIGFLLLAIAFGYPAVGRAIAAIVMIGVGIFFRFFAAR